MKLATEIRWQDRNFTMPVERIRASERWGYDALFTAESGGSDAFTPLGYAAAVTERLQLGTCIAQVTGRSAAVTAGSYQTLSAMSGRPVIAGLGNSNPFVSRTVHGQPWGNPVERMRDFATLLRQAFEGQPLAHQGRELRVPFDDSPPQPLRLEPTPEVPIIMAAARPQMISLAAEVADGWFPVNFAPGMLPAVQPLLDKGFERAGGGKGMSGFNIWVHVDCMLDDDVRAAMRPFKEYVVMWAELQAEVIAMRGFPEMAQRVLELKAAGRVEEAVDAVEDEYIDSGWLVGPVRRMADRLTPWLESGATGLIVRYGPQGFDQAMTEPLEVFEAIGRRVHG